MNDCAVLQLLHGVFFGNEPINFLSRLASRVHVMALAQSLGWHRDKVHSRVTILLHAQPVSCVALDVVGPMDDNDQ